MQAADKFRDMMYNGAKRHFIGGSLLLLLLFAAPALGIAFALGLQEDPQSFFVVFLVTSVPTAGLIVACFYDAYGPVIEAQTQAAQQIAFNIAVTAGSVSVSAALAASDPKTALKTARNKASATVRPHIFVSAVTLEHGVSLGCTPQFPCYSLRL